MLFFVANEGVDLTNLCFPGKNLVLYATEILLKIFVPLSMQLVVFMLHQIISLHAKYIQFKSKSQLKMLRGTPLVYHGLRRHSENQQKYKRSLKNDVTVLKRGFCNKSTTAAVLKSLKLGEGCQK